MVKRFFLQNLQLQDLNPRICGIRDLEPGEILFHHRVVRYVLHYVTHGRGLYLAKNHSWQLSTGDVFISHPGDSVRYISDSEQPMTYIWVGFDCAEGFAAALDQTVISAPWAKTIFADLLRCSESAAPEWSVCVCLYRYFVSLAQQQSVQTVAGGDYVNRAAQFIQTNLSEDIRIADLAADLGLSRSYFCRIFKEQMGQSPQEYLVGHRLDAAAALLAEQGLSQKETALRVGYSDVCTFSRMFKRKFGVSPGEYVKRNKTE